MVHLRLIVDHAMVTSVVDRLRGTVGVAHVVRVPAAETTPPGELVLCDVAREAANGVVEWLQDLGVHRSGAIVMTESDIVVSEAARRADERAAGFGADAIIWEELEAAARDNSQLTASFIVFMTIAAIVAAVGIMIDAPILLVGAMVLGPEYGPLSALCVAATRRRWDLCRQPAVTLVAGLLVAAIATLAATAIFRATGIAPDRYGVDDRQLTAFVSRPDALAAVVAVLAGVAGMLSLTTSRSSVLIGVLVSVTTIPAAANAAVAAAYGQWGEVAGAALQLGINLTGLVIAGVATLAVQGRRFRPIA